MIYLAEQAIRSAITGLDFVERYGGFTRPLTATIAGKRKTFPVAYYLSDKQCFEDGLFEAWTPDDKYKSVCYWEQAGPNSITYQKEFESANRMRFICWLNLQKLGISTPTNPERFALAVMKAIKGRRSFNIGSVQGTVDFNSFQMQYDQNTVFGSYSYSDRNSLFFFPYAFFAFDCTANVKITDGCIPALTVAEGLACEPDIIA